MSLFKKKIPLSITLISLTIGFMISIQYHSTQEIRTLHSRDITEIRSDLSSEVARNQALLKDLEKKQILLSQYKNNNVNQEKTDIMREELDKSRMLAGLTAVKGKGIIVTIRSYSEGANEQAIENLVVDDDLRTLVNELFANGAQAISINGERLISNSSIRNVGNQIQVNNRFIHLPYEIKAIGEQETMKAGLTVAGLPDYFKLLNKELITLDKEIVEVPAFTGNIQLRYVKPVKAGDK